MLQMDATALEQTCRRHAKLSIIQTDLSMEILLIFAIFSAFTLHIGELKALNTAQIGKIPNERSV